MPRISRRAMAAIIAVSTLLPGAAFAADPLKEIRIDWATYNPVSIVLKQKGLLEKEFAKDGISEFLSIARGAAIIDLQAGVAAIGEPLHIGAIPPVISRPGTTMHVQYQWQISPLFFRW